MSPQERMARSRWTPEKRIKLFGSMIGIGFLLFLHVWCPIQSERASIQLKKVESQIAQKKAELNELNQRMSVMTSLSSLDRWARSNGPWRVPSEKDIITING